MHPPKGPALVGPDADWLQQRQLAVSKLQVSTLARVFACTKDEIESSNDSSARNGGDDDGDEDKGDDDEDIGGTASGASDPWQLHCLANGLNGDECDRDEPDLELDDDDLAWLLATARKRDDIPLTGRRFDAFRDFLGIDWSTGPYATRDGIWKWRCWRLAKSAKNARRRAKRAAERQ